MSVTAHPLSIRIGAWIAGGDRIENGDVLLDRRRVYILPTRAGALFAAAVIVLLIGSINYGLQLGYLLTFVVASMAVVGMYHTHRNLARVLVRGDSVLPVFAGDVASFEVLVTNPTPETRYSLRFNFVLPTRRRTGRFLGRPFGRENPRAGTFADAPARGSCAVRLALPTRRRGQLSCPRIRIETRFPFGLWQAWSYLRPGLVAIVYPAPEEDAPPLPLATGGAVDGTGLATSGDDFGGVRPYQAGDARKMIAWRLSARSDELSVKLFDSTAGGELVLDFGTLPSHLNVEQKLSRLTRWVLSADTTELRYALALPGTNVPLGNGADHRDRCLTALALYRG